jgi:predicted Zn-dependent protease
MSTVAGRAVRPASEIGEHSFPLDLLDSALAQSADGAAELVLVRQRLGLARFSRGRIHQHVEEESARLSARAWTAGGRGVRVADGAGALAPADVLAAARDASALADAEAIELPSAPPPNDVGTWSEATAGADAAGRAARVAAALARADGRELSGHLRVAVQDVTIANTSGLRAFVPLTFASFVVSAVAGRGVTGAASRIGRDLDALDLEGAVDEAVAVAIAAERPARVAPGDRRVLLDPAAVSMLLLNLGIIGLDSFGAGGAAKGTSFVAANEGRPVASEAVTLVDDGRAAHGLPVPFDLEGTPKRLLTIVDRGIAAGVAHDLTSAARAGVPSTGHALLPGMKGPLPTALRVESGSEPRDALLRSLGSGLVVRRIHPFVSLRGGPGAELSGTSRDGVFVVEGGEVVGAAANVRWSCSAVELLRSVEAASQERSVEFMDLPELFPTTNDVPSLLCGRLRIHGSQPRE